MGKHRCVKAWGFVKANGSLHKRTVDDKEVARLMTVKDSCLLDIRLLGAKVVRVEVRVCE